MIEATTLKVLEHNVKVQKNDKNPEDATFWSAALSLSSKEIG